MAPALTPITLERAGASGTLCAALYISLCVLVPIVWGFGTRFYNGGAAGRGLAQASPTIVGVWVNRSLPVRPSSPMTPVPWLLGALAEHVLCSALVKAAISLAIWCPSSFEPEGTSVAAADRALTLVSSVFALSSSCSDHQLGIGGLWITVEILHGVSDVFLNTME